jgi:hypothetical protein
VIDAPAEISTSPALLVLATVPDGADGIEVAVQSIYKQNISSDEFGYGKLSQDWSVPAGIERAKCEVDLTDTGLIFTPMTNIEALTSTHAQWQRLTYVAIVGNEFIGFQYCTELTDGSGNYRLSGLIRGLNNSLIEGHRQNDDVWISYYPANQLESVACIPSGIDVSVKLTAYNNKGKGTPVTINHPYAYTGQKPYPPFNITVSDDIFGSNESETRILTFDWQTATRNNGANYRDPDSFPAGEVASEGSWQILLYLIDPDGNETEINSTATTNTKEITIPVNTASYTYLINSILDGWSSYVS